MRGAEAIFHRRISSNVRLRWGIADRGVPDWGAAMIALGMSSSTRLRSRERGIVFDMCKVQPKANRRALKRAAASIRPYCGGAVVKNV